MGLGGAVVNSVPCVRRVARSNPSLAIACSVSKQVYIFVSLLFIIVLSGIGLNKFEFGFEYAQGKAAQGICFRIRPYFAIYSNSRNIY